MREPRIRVDVFRWRKPANLVTVTTDHNGGGTRVCGPRMLPGDASLLVSFYLDRKAIDALSDDLESVIELAKERP